MRHVTSLLALIVLTALTATAFAADAPPAAPATPAPAGERHDVLHGVVKKVDGKAITVALGKDENAKEVVVETDDNTRVTIDHEPAKLEDIKEGEVVAIGPSEGIAHHIDVNTTHKTGAKAHVLHGIVKKVDGKSITVSIGKGEKAREVVVETDDTTTVTVDHEPAKLEDIKEGELVAVAPAQGVAHHIDLNTTHKGDAGKDAAAPK